MLDELLSLERYPVRATSTDENPDKGQISNFRVLFYATITSMKEAGTTVFSPGGSYRRRFLIWYNAHYWAGLQNTYQIEINPQLINSFHFTVWNYYHSNKFKINELVVVSNENVFIRHRKKLTPLGKDFLLSLSPFKTVRDKVHFVD